jgi:hypothetical protein
MIAARPARTHVMAVGVSTYADVGSSWTLEAAAEHAVQFVEWACGAGVPPNHVHLFLSSADHARFAARLAAIADVEKRQVTPRVATVANILDFRLKELPQLSGDLLYFYWSGHGSFLRNRRLLFCEDQHRSGYLQFDLDDFLTELRSRNFGVQIGYVDACANFFDRLGLRGQPGSFSAATEAPRSDVRQMWLCAADSGQQAIGGAFSRTLLEQLAERRRADGAWPVDHEAIIEAVNEALIGGDDGPGQQRPVQISWVRSTGDSRVQERGDVPAESFVNAVAASWGLPVAALRQLADLAAQSPSLQRRERRDELFHALAAEARLSPDDRGGRVESPELDLLYIIASAFRWESPTSDTQPVLARLDAEISRVGATSAEFAIELGRARVISQAQACVRQQPIEPAAVRKAYLQTIETLPLEPERGQAVGLVAMLDRLTQLPPKDDLPFGAVWEFLLRLADRAPEARAAITALVDARARNVLALKALRASLQHERRYLLSIRVNYDDSQESTPAPGIVEARLLVSHTMERIKELPSINANGSWASAREAVAALVKKARKEVSSVLAQNERLEDRLDIEFVLYEAFFTEAPDRFGIPLPIDPCPLGRVHPVVIRWVNRVEEPWDAGEVWFAIAAKIDRQARPKVRWLERAGREHVAACANGCDGLLALSFVPDLGAIVDLLNAGFPFVAWPRQAAQERPWEKFRSELDEWAARTSRFDELPRALRSIRDTDTALGSHLTLLWDDPSCPKYWLSQPVGAVE